MIRKMMVFKAVLSMSGFTYDVIIIGGGVAGCAVARELARYRARIALLERAEDVCSGASKANSGIVHAGFDAAPGTAKARFNLLGNRQMGALARELDFEFARCGSLVLCLDEADRPRLEALAARGRQNGVPGLEILPGDEVRRREPMVSERCVAALWAPTGGIVCPFGLTIALAENACDNGVTFLPLTEVTAIARMEGGYRVETGRGALTARCVVNAAGVYADVLHNQVSARRLHITPRKGDYCLLDKTAGGHVRSTIFQLPGAAGKGVLVTPTVHGNLLLGPTATDQTDRENTATTAAELDFLQRRAAEGVRALPLRAVITAFSGLRAHEDGGDFALGSPGDAPGFFDAAGIESPGLTSAPAIGRWLAERVAAYLGAPPRADWQPRRRGILRAASLPEEERRALIARQPAYGAIVCRCEQISEGEILDAIARTPGARSLDGLKRRVRQGMGRCQGGFCTPRAMELLAQARGIPPEAVCKNGPGSRMIAGEEGAQ